MMPDVSRAAALLRALGDAYLGTDPVDAEESYRRSLALEPQVASAHAGLARALVDLDRYAEAEAQLERALAIDPEHEDAACLYTSLLVENGLVPRALERYVKAVANGAGARVLTEFADLLARLGLRGDAELMYRIALGRGRSVEAHTNLALVLIDLDRLDEALVELERALTLDPEAPEARLNRANVLVELGHYEEAAEAFAPLVDDPDAGGAALWGLAAIRDACGDTVGALRARSVAITRIPELTRRCQSAARGAALRA